MTRRGGHPDGADGSRSSAPLVVLGCRLTRSSGGNLGGALGRRLVAAYASFLQLGGWLVVSGGRTWGGIVEADAMCDELEQKGVPLSHIVRERCSLTTRGNALFTTRLLRRMGVRRVRLVTCDWHMPRAVALFQRERLDVDAVPAPSPTQPRLVQLYRHIHERISLGTWTGRVT